MTSISPSFVSESRFISSPRRKGEKKAWQEREEVLGERTVGGRLSGNGGPEGGKREKGYRKKGEGGHRALETTCAQHQHSATKEGNIWEEKGSENGPLYPTSARARGSEERDR